jgi:predicted CXXCH cytochrome family protein
MRRLATVVLMLWALPSSAGDYHNAQRNNCSDCHTTHASAHENLTGGAPITMPDAVPGSGINAYVPEQPNGNRTLLKHDADEICLSCHDGSRLSAGIPGVVAPVIYVSDPAGGAFEYGNGFASAHGHDLEDQETVPPGAPDGTQPMRLSCSTCHDPHGNGNYRNLRPNPSNRTVTNVSVTTRQNISGEGHDPADIYVPGNLIDKNGISAWCNTCHGETPTSACRFQHPVDRTIWSAAGASYTRWSSGISGRVRAGSPSDNIIPSTDDRVICVSCHKAHGSNEPNSLIDADTTLQGRVCAQCHTES